MLRWLVRLGAEVTACLLVLGLVGWQWGGQLLFWYMRPSIAFEADLPAPPPDYTQPPSWAALPDRRDNADVVPLDSGADVFFLQPTTYYNSAHWNGPIDDSLHARRLLGILAGHSQGSGHARRLLDEFFEAKPLGARLVAAYAGSTSGILVRALPGQELPHL
jgi:hypothetical protein